MPAFIEAFIKIGIVVLIVYFCVQNSDLAQKKGQSAVKYVLLTLLFAFVLPRIIVIAGFIGLLLAGFNLSLDSLGAEIIFYIILAIATLGGALISEGFVDRSENIALKYRQAEQEKMRRKIEEAEKEAVRKALAQAEKSEEAEKEDLADEEDDFAVSAGLNALEEDENNI